MSDTTLHPVKPTSHLANGKFAPGNALGGRAKRTDETAIIKAMDAALPPEEIEKLLKEAIGWAREYKSPKLALAICQFVVSYQIGQPVQRSLSASGKLETLLGKLNTMSEDEFKAVEATIREGK